MRKPALVLRRPRDMNEPDIVSPDAQCSALHRAASDRAAAEKRRKPELLCTLCGAGGRGRELAAQVIAIYQIFNYVGYIDFC